MADSRVVATGVGWSWGIHLLIGSGVMATPDWTDVGAVDALSQMPVQPLLLGRTHIALTYKDGVFGAISGVCNHAGGALQGLPYARGGRKAHRLENKDAIPGGE